MMYELVIKARKPKTSYNSLGEIVTNRGLMTGRRQGVSSSPWRVCSLQILAKPSRLTSSNMSAPSLRVILKMTARSRRKGIY